MEKTRIKMICLFSEKNKFIGKRVMNREDVQKYFNNIRRNSSALSRKLGEFCERCGRTLGIRKTEMKKMNYKTFFVDSECLEELLKPNRTIWDECVPDFEDLERFNVFLG